MTSRSCAECGAKPRVLTLDHRTRRWLCSGCLLDVRDKRAEAGLPADVNYATVDEVLRIITD